MQSMIINIQGARCGKWPRLGAAVVQTIAAPMGRSGAFDGKAEFTFEEGAGRAGSEDLVVCHQSDSLVRSHEGFLVGHGIGGAGMKLRVTTRGCFRALEPALDFVGSDSFALPLRFRQSSSVVEQRTHKPLVAGSIPASGTTFRKKAARIPGRLFCVMNWQAYLLAAWLSSERTQSQILLKESGL